MEKYRPKARANCASVVGSGVRTFRVSAKKACPALRDQVHSAFPPKKRRCSSYETSRANGKDQASFAHFGETTSC
jgi:hypothetical protein